MQSDLIGSFAAIVGHDAVLSGTSAAPYVTDWRGRYSGNAIAVVFPSDNQQVSQVVALCAASKTAVVPQGGNTSLCGGSVPLRQGRQIILNLSRMNRIRAIDPVNYTMTVEAGCTLAHVRAEAEHHDRQFPLGLTAVADLCQIGGNLSTNAGGIGVLRYGNARDLVLGLEVVLADGRIWNGLRRLRKDNTGYDLKHLFIGAEGTLGVITAAVLKLFPRPRAEATGCIAVSDPSAAVSLLSHLRARCGDRISAFEIMSRSCLDLVLKHIPNVCEPFDTSHDWIVIAQLTDTLDTPLDRAMQDALQSFEGGIIAFSISGDKEHAERWWLLRRSISEAQKREGISIKHDVSVPVSHVAQFIARADRALRDRFDRIRLVAFGHMGDGNIHYNASMPDREQNKAFIERFEGEVNRIVYEVVDDLKGSISAEHGLGQLKREEIKRHKAPLELGLMRQIKHALDPKGIMNPGKVI